MRASVAVRLTTFVALLTCGRGPGSPTTSAPLDLAPLVSQVGSLSGWKTVEGPEAYSPETLFEALDGGAPVYLAYGFRQLLRVRYQVAADSLAYVTFDLFDMGTPLGAFGIFRSALPASAPQRPWGTEGYRFGTVAAAWKGAIYVHAEADADRPALVDALERGVARACDAVAGETGLPRILAPLPLAHLVPRSERYVARDLLGHDFLPDGVVANYRIDERESELFFSELASPAAARAAFGRLRDHHAARGAVAGGRPDIGSDGFRFSDGVSGGGTAVRAGQFVAGVRGDVPAPTQEQLLARLVANLEANGPE